MFEDYINILCAHRNATRIQVKAHAHFLKETPNIAIKCELWDTASGMMLAFKQVEVGSAVSKLLTWDYPFSDKDKKDLSVKVGFLWVNDPGDVMFGCVGQQVIDYGDKAVASALSVTKPRAGDKKLTKVLYYRSGKGYDYFYKNPTYGNETKVMMPFTGTFTLRSDEWSIVRIEDGHLPGFEAPSLWMFVRNGSSVEYKRDMISQLLIKDEKTISWDFNDDWGSIFYKDRIKSDTTLDFFCRFYILLKKKGEQSQEVYRYQDVVVTSLDIIAGELEAVGRIEPIHLLYGCMAEDTDILMADGSEKRISLIKPGDIVFTESGASEVRNVTSGLESELVCVEAENRRLLRITSGHPVRTRRGFVRADDLTAADTLILHNGVESRVISLYTEEYSGQVYNLITADEGSPLVGNGFVVGDFTMQNSLRVETAKSVECSEELLAAQKAFTGICVAMKNVGVEKIESVIAENLEAPASTLAKMSMQARMPIRTQSSSQTGRTDKPGSSRILTVPSGSAGKVAELLSKLYSQSN